MNHIFQFSPITDFPNWVIEHRAYINRKVLEEEETGIFHLPEWHDGQRGTPNDIIRSTLFAAIQGRDRTYLENVTLFSQEGVTIKFTGKQLNQEDLTTWITLLHLARKSMLSAVCEFTGYEILKALKLPENQ